MEQKICLDTDVIIAILNNESRSESLLDKISQSDIYMTTINLFEMLLRERNLDEVETFRNKTEILNFDESSSRRASEIQKDLKKKGKTVEFRDVFIASICMANNCTLATFNIKHFENIKDLKILKI